MGLEPTLPERLPWSVRMYKRLLFPAALLPWAPLVMMLRQSAFAGHAEQVPEDICALLPADLVARVVPAAKFEGVKADNSGTYNNTAECNAVTDIHEATTTASSSVSIRLTRHGPTSARSSENHAQNSFALSKRWRMANASGRRVFDLSKLGDSAYLTIVELSELEHSEQHSRVEVSVLRKDIELSVQYYASPTDDSLSSSAAVAVAHALMGALP